MLIYTNLKSICRNKYISTYKNSTIIIIIIIITTIIGNPLLKAFMYNAL